MARTEEEIKREREDMIRLVADRLVRRGYEDIRASRLKDYEGRKPNIIYWEGSDEGFMPDIIATRAGKQYLFEVETAETVDGEMAEREASLFSAYAKHYGRHFCLVVPYEAKDRASAVLTRVHADERHAHIVGI